MSVGVITFGDLFEASKLHDVNAACLVLQEKAGIESGDVASIMIDEELWALSTSEARRMRMLMSWLLVEYTYEKFPSE